MATCSTTDGNGSYYGITPSFFEELTRCRRQKHCRQRPDNPNGPSKFHNCRVYFPHLRLCDRDCCSAADDSGSCHAPAPSYFEDMTRCRRKNLHWRWSGNPSGRSKFHNLGLFTFTRSQLMLRGWWRLPEIAQTARCRRQKHRQRWPGSIEIPQIRKFMPTRSSKASRKTSFCCYDWRRDWWHCALFTFRLSFATAFVFKFEK